MRDFWLPSAATTRVSEWINYVYWDHKILNPAVGCLSVVVDCKISLGRMSEALSTAKETWHVEVTVLMKQLLSQTTVFVP